MFNTSLTLASERSHLLETHVYHVQWNLEGVSESRFRGSAELTEERGWERKRGREGMEEKVKEGERINPGEL